MFDELKKLREKRTKAENMLRKYLKTIEIKKTLVYEKNIKKDFGIEIGSLVLYEGKQYYVTGCNYCWHSSYDWLPKSIQKARQEQFGGYFAVTLNKKCDKNYQDGRKWYVSENNTLIDIDVRLLELLKNDDKIRTLAINQMKLFKKMVI